MKIRIKKQHLLRLILPHFSNLLIVGLVFFRSDAYAVSGAENAASDRSVVGTEHALTERYIWAAQGANLRETPSSDARIIKKLGYGTPVSIADQGAKQVPYEMGFFPKIATSAKNGKPRSQAVLGGNWIKIQTRDQQGYVFDKLLLAYAPIKKDEGLESYFARIFELKALPSHKSATEEGKMETKYVARGARKVQLSAFVYPQSSAGGGDIFIPDMPFDEAFIFVNAICPPELEEDYAYQDGLKFEYVPVTSGSATLTREKGGVHFSWIDEP